MPTPVKGPRLGGGPAHERLMLANLASQLFEHGRITTTETKAKRLRPYAERLVTFGKRGDLHARRQVLKVIRDKSVVHALFAEIGPRYANRPGGYTRITKIGVRKGDNAPMAVIELVEALTVAQQAVGEAERARGSRFAGRRAPTGATRAAAADLAAESPVAAGVAAEAEDVEEARHAAAAAPIVDEQLAGAALEDAPREEAPHAEAPAAETATDTATAEEPAEAPAAETATGEEPAAEPEAGA